MRYYDIPKDDFVLVLYGDEWRRKYEYILHIHNLMEFGICRSGDGVIYLEDQEVAYSPGMITCIPENYIHTTLSNDEDSSKWEYVFLNIEKILFHFYPENEFLRAEMEQAVRKHAFYIEPGQNPAMEIFMNLLIDEMQKKDILYKECQKSLSLDLLLQVIRVNEREDFVEKYQIVERNTSEQVRAGIQFIHDHYTLELKSSEIAAHCHMSESHYWRLFKSSTGMTPMDYLNVYRIKKACEMIQGSDDEMKDIAQKCGFSSISTFNRNFRKNLGMSPIQWKKHADYYKRNLKNYNIHVKKGW